MIEESFIDFIHSHEKTEEGLTTEILNKLEGDKLDINDARGQGYDNGANMAGKYKGVRARILEINSLAIFIPCAAHNLNLAGVHAGSTSPEMITFFGTVQRLFNFFSSSTTRWEILMKSLKLTLKSFSDTRWSSKANAITSLSLHLSEVKKGLESISNDLSNPEAVSNAKSLLLLINYRFICTLSMWNKILQCIDRKNKALQRKDISIDHAAKLIDALRCTLQGLREADFEQNFQEAKNLAKTMNLQAGFPDKRKKKVKKMANYEATDEGSNMTPEHLFKMQIYKIFDTLLSQLDWRYEQLRTVCNDFSFLYGMSLESTSVLDLKKSAADLAIKYSKDLNMYQFTCEIQSFKFEASTIIPNIKTATLLDILQELHDFDLIDSYPNINIAIRIFLTLPVTTASCERSFSKLKLIKNYLRSTIGQERLSNLSIISIEYNIVKDINYDGVINEFAQMKARKVQF
ncbi:zinc finger MYM-type protein 1-like [Hydra vulgaris]|uniref:Zinc finger MYM-type protein 1-like n=1 Tax=Hydra vulgaris TaxID=6087 RepID=A0ABM4DC28_HYDVU